MKFFCLVWLSIAFSVTLCAQRSLYAKADKSDRLMLTGNLNIDLFSPSETTQPFSDTSKPMTLHDHPDYRSPMKAALFSAILPGAGQFYSNKYVQSIAFLGAEVGLWIVYAMYERKGDNQTADFQAFADQHWSVVRYVDWITRNVGQLNPAANTSGIITSTDPSLKPWDQVDWSKLNAVENLIAQNTGNGFTHLLPHRPEQQYYELIGKYPQFLGGWDDGNSRTPGDVIASNVSPNFSNYSHQRGDANSFYVIATTTSYIIVANHVLSAVEAAWTAATKNSNLKLGASIHPTMTGDGVVEFVPTATLRFDF